ncbi:MAG: nucleotide-diphospho-sugar transferase [Rhizobiales bacterium]|nr:nucleotide-diphospho-sugar transferase [Hyphomicrobiales bacterium]
MLFKLIDTFRTWGRAQRAMAITFPSVRELAARRRADGGATGTIVAFYTKNSFYETEKDRLVKSARHLGLDVQATAVESAGSWVRNAGLKPGVLLELRRTLRGPLLYVDVDAVFHHDPWPELLKMDADIAAYYEGDTRLISATILLNDTPATLDLLAKWKQGCMDAPEVWDQVVLERIIAEDAADPSPAFRVGRLPVSFCWIFDRTRNAPVERVYIEQLQASREATKSKHLFNRIGKRLSRRRDRVAEIERILNMQADEA